MANAHNNYYIVSSLLNGVEVAEVATKLDFTPSQVSAIFYEIIGRLKRPDYHVKGAETIGPFTYKMRNIRSDVRVRDILLGRLEKLKARDLSFYGDERDVPFTIGKRVGERVRFKEPVTKTPKPVKVIKNTSPINSPKTETAKETDAEEFFRAVAFVEDIAGAKVVLRGSQEFRSHSEALIAVEALRKQFGDNASYGIETIWHLGIEEV